MNTVLIPLIIYMIGVFTLAFFAGKRVTQSVDLGIEGFFKEYFIGGREFGGLIVALTLVATYASASSFLGGPGVAYARGLSWILLAMTQLPTAYLTLAILGKKFAIISRRIKAVTLLDIYRERYKSPIVVIIGAISIIFFFAAIMVAQYIGGARLFQSVTGLSYPVSLGIFAIAVMIYVTIGGYRAVALSDALQGVMMLLGTGAILIGIIIAGGGVENIIKEMYKIDPGLITPFGPNNSVTKPFIMSFWVLVGIGVVGLPQVAVRAMTYKDSKAMHSAMIIGTVVVGFLMLGMHLAGAFGRVIVGDIAVADTVMPKVTMAILPPVLAGVFLAGPLAAIMSTVDSLLIMMSAAIVNDVYVNYIDRNASINTLKSLTLTSTAILGGGVFLAALRPPDFLVWINLFAFGGLQAAFFWPTILGLYWKRANGQGALASMIAGVGTFVYMTQNGISPWGTHPIVSTLIVAAIVLVAASLITPKPDEEIIQKFWG